MMAALHTAEVYQEHTIGDFNTHTVSRNVASLMSTLEDKSLLLRALTLATRLLEWENGLRIWSMIFFATEKVQIDEDLYVLRMAAHQCWDPGELHLAVQCRLAAMTEQVDFYWHEDLARAEDGSTELIGPRSCRIFINSELRFKLAEAPPGSLEYHSCLTTLANTLCHELAHAAMMLRADYRAGDRCVLEGCETSEEGFELEAALWGGVLLETRDMNRIVVPQMLQWPDVRITDAHDEVSGGQRIFRPSAQVARPWRTLRHEFLEFVCESSVETALRRPEPEDFEGYYNR